MRVVVLALLMSGCGASVAADAADGSDDALVSDSSVDDVATDTAMIDSSLPETTMIDTAMIDSSLPDDLPPDISVPEVAIDGGDCKETSDTIQMTLSGGGHDASCFPTGDASVTSHDFIGRVSATTATSIDVDTCPPWADCAPQIVHVFASAPGLDLTTVKKESYVRVQFDVSLSWGCTTKLTVRSVDAWGSSKNPIDSGGRVYLSASDGYTTTVAPFAVSRVRQYCLPPMMGCGGPDPADMYQLQFTGTGSGATSTSIAMGTTGTFVTNGQTLTARNLRSFYKGWCDEYWDYAWWVRGD